MRILFECDEIAEWQAKGEYSMALSSTGVLGLLTSEQLLLLQEETSMPIPNNNGILSWSEDGDYMVIWDGKQLLLKEHRIPIEDVKRVFPARNKVIALTGSGVKVFSLDAELICSKTIKIIDGIFSKGVLVLSNRRWLSMWTIDDTGISAYDQVKQPNSLQDFLSCYTPNEFVTRIEASVNGRRVICLTNKGDLLEYTLEVVATGPQESFDYRLVRSISGKIIAEKFNSRVSQVKYWDESSLVLRLESNELFILDMANIEAITAPITLNNAIICVGSGKMFFLERVAVEEKLSFIYALFYKPKVSISYKLYEFQQKQPIELVKSKIMSGKFDEAKSIANEYGLDNKMILRAEFIQNPHLDLLYELDIDYVCQLLIQNEFDHDLEIKMLEHALKHATGEAKSLLEKIQMRIPTVREIATGDDFKDVLKQLKFVNIQDQAEYYASLCDFKSLDVLLKYHTNDIELETVLENVPETTDVALYKHLLPDDQKWLIKRVIAIDKMSGMLELSLELINAGFALGYVKDASLNGYDIRDMIDLLMISQDKSLELGLFIDYDLREKLRVLIGHVPLKIIVEKLKNGAEIVGFVQELVQKELKYVDDLLELESLNLSVDFKCIFGNKEVLSPTNFKPLFHKLKSKQVEPSLELIKLLLNEYPTLQTNLFKIHELYETSDENEKIKFVRLLLRSSTPSLEQANSRYTNLILLAKQLIKLEVTDFIFTEFYTSVILSLSHKKSLVEIINGLFPPDASLKELLDLVYARLAVDGDVKPMKECLELLGDEKELALVTSLNTLGLEMHLKFVLERELEEYKRVVRGKLEAYLSNHIDQLPKLEKLSEDLRLELGRNEVFQLRLKILLKRKNTKDAFTFIKSALSSLESLDGTAEHFQVVLNSAEITQEEKLALAQSVLSKFPDAPTEFFQSYIQLLILQTNDVELELEMPSDHQLTAFRSVASRLDPENALQLHKFTWQDIFAINKTT